MNQDKIHERVLEIQKTMETSTPEQQSEMIGELLELVAKIEQSLSEIKININEEE